MLPLAMIALETGAQVTGSDRALDQGRLADKFTWLQSKGIALFSQDGSGLTSGDQTLVASAAVEDSVPDVAKANALGCARMTRAELLSDLFNAAAPSVAIGGTSGKSTVTGMIGWVAAKAGLDPTIMNGAVMKNFIGADTPFASSRVGTGGPMISEVDESDGSIALFTPDIAVLNNISVDHKTIEELRQLFGDFAAKAQYSVWNADDAESVALIGSLGLQNALSFGFSAAADIAAKDVAERPLGSAFTLHFAGHDYPVTLQVPGRHNIANALAALATAHHLGIPMEEAISAIEGFAGLARRFDVIGTAGDISVIDDFGHNPDKIAATLKTMKAFPGRIIAFFQPHGFGPIRKMGPELAQSFAEILDGEDIVLLCDPVYFGGTVDKDIGSDSVTDAVVQAGGKALHIASRDDCGDHIVEMARPGDRIVIMGARDDTLSQFAQDILSRLGR